MSEDIDAGINLNISVPSKKYSAGSQSSKYKISGNRGQRIRARKSLKILKQGSEITSVAEHQSTEHILESRSIAENEGKWKSKSRTESKQKGNKDEGRQKGSTDEGRQKKSGDVISSLFRHNPDIPTIHSGSVKPVKEALFSSDSFQNAPLHPYMISNLEKLGFTKMTSVQHETIPKLVNGHDLLVKSQTGSGKTMAYAIPIIERLCRYAPKLKRSDGCLAVILVPTRELALQSYGVFLKLLNPFTWLVPGCIMGGEKRKAEKARLRKGINILVATPGRLIDHIENTQNLFLEKIKWLILDEADRLLDLGFEEKVSKIIQAIDKHCTQRQTVLLSATLSQGVERLAGISLNNPQRVAISESSKTSQVSIKCTQSENHKLKEDATSQPAEETLEKFALPQNLKQYFVITPCKLRLVVLLTLILTKCRKEHHKKMIVFVSTQDGVEFLYRLVLYLSTDHSSDSDVEHSEPTTSLDAYHLHGDMCQKDRTATFHDFCSTKSGVLLCTDVAARGLHLPFVQWVIQYTCAAGVTDYVHRVGRTARAGSSGNTIMFLLPSEIDFVKHLNQQTISVEEMKLGEILQDVTKLMPTLPGVEETQRQTPRTIEETATYLQNCCELYIKNGTDMAGLAKRAYQSYIRAYATYPHALKTTFHVRNLHLGHVAKTFGLREAPSNIGIIPGVNLQKTHGKRKHTGPDHRPGLKKRRMDIHSEFKGPLVFMSHRKKSSKSRKQMTRPGKK